MDSSEEEFRLVSIEEQEPGWVSYELTGSNGLPIKGGMAGTLEEAKEVIAQQLSKANKRRLIRQRWVYWNWNPATPSATAA